MTKIAHQIVFDQGGFKGIYCDGCHRVHWDGELPLVDPMTGKECENCKLIKASTLLKDANSKNKK
jgi:hypothetical protein